MKSLFCLLGVFLFCNSSYSQTVSSCSLIELRKAIANTHEDIVIVNFWATYCRPCVAEIPDLMKVSEKYADKVRLVLVNLDSKNLYPKKINQFAKRHHIKSPIIWLNESDPNYFCAEINPGWQGSIPATLFINKKNGRQIFKEMEMSLSEMSETLEDLMREMK